jgi:hypothetical protein
MTHSHAHEPGLVMFEVEVFIGKVPGAIDAGRASTIAIEEITSLDHKILDLFSAVSGRVADERQGRQVSCTYHTMKLASLVALRRATRVLCFSGTELPEILSSSGSDMGKELNFDTAQGFAWKFTGLSVIDRMAWWTTTANLVVVS